MKIASAASAIVAAAGLGLVLAGPCAAQQAVPGREITRFSQCDGYGEPSSSADGMTKEANLLDMKGWFGSGGNTSKGGAPVGAAGVQACDVALADPLLKPTYWMRRVSLLRAKAIHQMAANDLKGALATLDQAQAAVQDSADPFYRRSLGFGLQMVRAYAMRRDGHAADAEKLVMTEWRPRRFDRQASISALMALGVDADPKDLHAVRLALAEVAPPNSALLFEEAMNAGDFAEVVRLYPQLTPPNDFDPNMKSDKELRLQEARDAYSAEKFVLEHVGRYAYALAATGQGDKARQVLADAKVQLAKAAEVPPAPVPDAKGKVKTDYVYELMSKASPNMLKNGGTLLDQWTTMVEWRIAVGAGHAPDVVTQIRTKKGLVFGPASVELLTQIAAQDPKDSRSAEMTAAGMQAELKVRDRPPVEQELALLFKSLPDPEIRERAPVMGERTQSAKEREGGQLGAPKRPYVEIKASDRRASPAMLDELALADAADYARRNGKAGFVVLIRHSWQVIDQTMMYGHITNERAAERWVELDVVPVDPANLPADLAGGGWRVLRADEVLAELTPIYGAAPPAASKTKG